MISFHEDTLSLSVFVFYLVTMSFLFNLATQAATLVVPWLQLDVY